jgi:hypothetical protein
MRARSEPVRAFSNKLKPGLLSRAAASRAALARCRGMDGERMHAALELGDKGFVDHAVALEPALPAERLSHNIHPEMSFPALPMPSMSGVLVGFIHHLEARGGESLGQLFCDDIAPCHGVRIAGARPAGQCPPRPRKRANVACQDLKMTSSRAHTDRS